MVNIPRRGADPFIVPADVDNGDYAVIVKEPYIQDAEKTRFHKERTVIVVQLLRNDKVFRWGLNTTSNDRLVKAFGEDGALWQGKQVKISIVEMNVSGIQKSVLYAVPVTQTSVAPAEKAMD